MQLEDLPLPISSVQASAACLRYADPFPPEPVKIHTATERQTSVCVKSSDLKSVKYLAPITGKVSLLTRKLN